MRWFLTFILLFQMTAVADIPALNLYSLHMQMIQNEMQKDVCVTAQISESTSTEQPQPLTTDVIEEQTADFTLVLNFSLSSLSFDRLLYHHQAYVFLKPSSYYTFQFPYTPLKNESKIFDVESLPS